MKHIVIKEEIGRSCRNCQNFIRVNEKGGYHGIVDKRGFCKKGTDGDFRLYISRTVPDCHVIDPYNNETYRIERKISSRRLDLSDQIEDGRTNIGKAFQKAIIDLSKTMREKHETRLSYLMMHSLRETFLTEWLLEDSGPDLMTLQRRKSMSNRVYNKMITNIQFLVSELITENDDGIENLDIIKME